jgi:hypothetical protein
MTIASATETIASRIRKGGGCWVKLRPSRAGESADEIWFSISWAFDSVEFSARAVQVCGLVASSYSHFSIQVLPFNRPRRWTGHEF